MIRSNGQPQVLAGPPSGEATVVEPQDCQNETRKALKEKVLPFVSSLAVHAAILVLAVAAARVMIQNHKTAAGVPLQEQTIIPVSAVNDQMGGVPNVGISDPLKAMSQDRLVDDATPDGMSSKRGPSLELTAGGPGSEGDGPAPLVLGAGSIGLGRNGTQGHAGGPGNGGNGADGLPAIFGAGPGGAIGAKNPVFDPGGNVRRIVFVCDASGSMLNKMATLKDELAKAVQGLTVVQSFNIIFFHDESFVTLDGNRLIDVTPQARRNAAKFLDEVTATGTTDPIRGLEVAFHQGPQLIYLLTDGDFPDNNAVLAKIHELNKGNKVKINTIAFVNDSDTDTAFKVLLKQIADESGGTYRCVNENELGR